MLPSLNEYKRKKKKNGLRLNAQCQARQRNHNATVHNHENLHRALENDEEESTTNALQEISDEKE